jgi:hypothetical protein
MKKLGLVKFLSFAFLIVFICPLYTSLCDAGTISDNFSSATINRRLWRPFEESPLQRVAQQGGELLIQIDKDSSGQGAGLVAKFLLKGNFDATVDYRLVTQSTGNGVILGFEGPGGSSDNKVFLVKRISLRPDDTRPDKEVYQASFNDGSWYGNEVATTDGQGSLRVTRVGSVLTGYYKQNGQWQQFASHDYSTSGYREWVEITLWAVATDLPTLKNIEIAFSNFQVTYDQIRYVSSGPASLMPLLQE